MLTEPKKSAEEPSWLGEAEAEENESSNSDFSLSAQLSNPDTPSIVSNPFGIQEKKEKPHKRAIVFMIGGLSMSEVKTAAVLNEKFNKDPEKQDFILDIFVGGTTIWNPHTFIEALEKTAIFHEEKKQEQSMFD